MIDASRRPAMVNLYLIVLLSYAAILMGVGLLIGRACA